MQSRVMVGVHRQYFCSPAKVNFSLRVLYNRGDGYHEISSIVQVISLCDRICICPSSSDTLTSTGIGLDLGESNLINRARSLFQQRTKCGHCDIHVDKHIPLSSGLGGGSSNVATTFWGLNRVYNTAINEKDLSTWAAEISSDGPLFFSSGAAHISGRGESVKSLNQLFFDRFYIASTGIETATSAVFKNLKSTDLNPFATCKHGENDLENVACALDGRLKSFRNRLRTMGFSKVFMTGSGSAFCCLGDFDPPSVPGITFFKVTPIQRLIGHWYGC